jgi:hypothetical protein
MERKTKKVEDKIDTKFVLKERVRTLTAKGKIKAGSVGVVISVLTEPIESYVVEFVKDNGEPIDRPTYVYHELRWID